MRLSIRVAAATLLLLPIATLVLSMTETVDAQRAIVVPQATKPAATDLTTLLNRIERLEKRVDDLEKGSLTFENKADDDAKDAVLEERLAALEKSRSSDSAGGRSPSTRDGVTRVQAPFEVVTADGRKVAKIDGDAGGGLFLYNLRGSRIAHIGANSQTGEAGHVSVFSSRGEQQTSLHSSSNGGGVIFLRSAGGGPAMVMNGDNLEFNIMNRSGQAVVTMLAGTSGNGRIEVADAGGNNMVQAGVTTDGVGLVRAGPAGCQTVGALAQPCRIIGTK